MLSVSFRLFQFLPVEKQALENKRLADQKVSESESEQDRERE